MIDIRFGLDVEPYPKGRPKFVSRGKFVRVYTPAATVKAENQIIKLAEKYAPAEPIQRPVEVELAFTFTPPASRPKWMLTAALMGWAQHDVKPDLDNLAKLVLDALTRSGRFWRDDAQIVKLSISKGYGEQPQVWCRIAEVRCVTTREEWEEVVQEGGGKISTPAA